MYLDFYRLKEKPFTLSPDPRYLFYSHRHKEALSQMVYAITQQHGYMVLTGDVGTGKTTLINALLHCLPKDLVLAKIYHTVLSPKGLIQNICKEFGIEFANHSMVELIFKLHEYLKSSYRTGKKSILILDEAQNLGENILEEIRLLSNFEAEREKFLQIVLVGQPELDAKLSSVNMRQLRERIGLRFRLDRLNRDETKNYINHRLKVAGCQHGVKLFMPDSIDRIHFLSRGVPRRINTLCDNALLKGYLTNSIEISAHMIESLGFEDDFQEHGSKARSYAQRKQESEVDSLKTSYRGGHATENINSDKVITVTEKKGSKAQSSTEKNGEMEYQNFKKLMGRFLTENKMFLSRKPSFSRIFSKWGLVLIMFVLTFILAILLSKNFDVLDIINALIEYTQNIG